MKRTGMSVMLRKRRRIDPDSFGKGDQVVCRVAGELVRGVLVSKPDISCRFKVQISAKCTIKVHIFNMEHCIAEPDVCCRCAMCEDERADEALAMVERIDTQEGSGK